MRVSQLDSHLLDQELFTLLYANVDSALSLFKTTSALPDVTKVLLRAVIWKVGIWDHDNTYGAQLQSLRYFNLTRSKKLILGLISVFGPILQEKVGGELHGRWRRIAAYAEGLYEVLTMANFVAYIAGARYDSVLHRLLRIQLRPTSDAYRAVSFEFLNRQLIWSQFTEFLLVFLPLLHLPRLRRKLAAYLPRQESQRLGFLPQRVCAICYSEGVDGADIVNPYEADCGDLYCYGCVVSQITLAEGEGWECLRCGEKVLAAKPWHDVSQDNQLPAKRLTETIRDHDTDEDYSDAAGDSDRDSINDDDDDDSSTSNESDVDATSSR